MIAPIGNLTAASVWVLQLTKNKVRCDPVLAAPKKGPSWRTVKEG